VDIKLVKVTIPISLDKDFDYYYSGSQPLRQGVRVLVDFNGKKQVGIVLGLKNYDKSKGNIVPSVNIFGRVKQLKPIIDVLDVSFSLTYEQVSLSELLSNFYSYPKGDFLSMMLPAYLRRPNKLDLRLGEACRRDKESHFSGEFIKGVGFLERYSIWKAIVKEKLLSGSVLICFPQLSYLEAALKIIENDFDEKIVVMHSKKTEKQIMEGWKVSRQKTLILGTRLSLFYYPDDLNLIVIEEENDHCYFQEEKPFYHLRDIALMISQRKGIKCLLCDNYPSLLAYQMIKKNSLILREKKGPESRIKVVKLTGYSKGRVISPVLLNILGKVIKRDRRVVVIWNRKGFGKTAFCSHCGYVFKCSRCSSFLQLSLKSREGICPHCQQKVIISQICNKCNSGYVKVSGWGIEKIESILRKNFPEARIDSWEERSLNSQIVLSTSKILSSLYKQETFDTGIVLDIDGALSYPGYQVTFDAFLYLKKLECFFKDCLYVLTGNGDYYLFQSLSGSWEKFYQSELSFREALRLPPSFGIGKIILRSEDESILLKTINNLHDRLEKKNDHVYGPFKEKPFKLRGKYRYSLVIKSKEKENFRENIKAEIKSIRGSKMQLAIIFE